MEELEKLAECLRYKLSNEIVNAATDYFGFPRVNYNAFLLDLADWYLVQNWAYKVNKGKWYIDGHNAVLAMFNFLGFEYAQPDICPTYIVYKRIGPKGKVYIGLTSTTPEYRAGKGGWKYKDNPKMFVDILIYGWESFKTEVMAEGLSPREADELETKLIAEYNAVEEGYNNDDKQ